MVMTLLFVSLKCSLSVQYLNSLCCGTVNILSQSWGTKIYRNQPSVLASLVRQLCELWHSPSINSRRRSEDGRAHLTCTIGWSTNMQQHARNRKATTPARMEAGRNDASGRKRQPAGQRSTTLMVRAGLAIAAFSLGLFSGEYLWPRQADNLAPIANDHARKVHISGGVAGLDVLETEGGQLRETAYQAAGAAPQQLPRVGSLRRETSKINGNAGSLPEAHTNAGEASGAVKAKASLVDLVQKIETRHTNAIPAEEVASPGGTARKTPTSSNLDAAVRDINALPVPSKVGGKVEAVFEADTIKSSISEWNGHHAAYSLTLDDGSDGMITFAPMTMNEFGCVFCSCSLTMRLLSPPPSHDLQHQRHVFHHATVRRRPKGLAEAGTATEQVATHREVSSGRT